MRLLLCSFLWAVAHGELPDRGAVPNAIMNNSWALWEAYRDPATGLHCDSISFDGALVCGGTAATVTIALAIPATALTDIARGEMHVSAEWVCGAAAIGLAFSLL